MREIDTVSEKLTELDAALSHSGEGISRFAGEFAQLRETLVYGEHEMKGLTRSLGTGMRRAYDDLLFEGKSLSETLRGLARNITQGAYSTAMRPVQNAIGEAVGGGLNGLLSGLMPFEKGGAFSAGRVMPFAQGGVVSSAIAFPMRGGTGLMGEAGPEAIMPLARGPDGRLGVAASGGGRGPVQVVMNISTPDAEGFRRSQGQIAQQMGRLMARGQRNG